MSRAADDGADAPAERALERSVTETTSEEATLELAARRAKALAGGTVIHLHGPLGAGKTHFVKGLAMGLGLNPDDVVSPTYTLVHAHAAVGDAPGLVHVDLYRLADPGELVELGLEALPGPDAIAAVEWPEILPAAAAATAVHVSIEDLGGDRRRITIEPGPAGATAPSSILG